MESVLQAVHKNAACSQFFGVLALLTGNYDAHGWRTCVLWAECKRGCSKKKAVIMHCNMFAGLVVAMMDAACWAASFWICFFTSVVLRCCWQLDNSMSQGRRLAASSNACILQDSMLYSVLLVRAINFATDFMCSSWRKMFCIYCVL